MLEFKVNAGVDAATAALGDDVAVAEPAEFEAVTLTARVEPVSEAPKTPYSSAVAPGIGAQFSPWESQRSHWYAKEAGCPDHVPVEAPTTDPKTGTPVTTGAPFTRGVEMEPAHAGRALHRFRLPPVTVRPTSEGCCETALRSWVLRVATGRSPAER
jgi:hypothetical protein